MSEVKKLITELAEITELIENLNERRKAIESCLLIKGAESVKDTKLKSTDFCDDAGNKATYTEAQSLTVISPEYLKKLFGTAYKDIISETVETKYKVSSKQFEKMLAALYLNDYSRITLDDFWEQLPTTENAKKALRRKLKGTDFTKDKDFLMKIGGFSETDAVDYAYLYAEASVWSTVVAVCQLAGMPVTESNIETIIYGINAAVSVTETSKLKLERSKNGFSGAE